MIYKITTADQLYEFYEMVGEGSFSKVYRAKFLPTGQIMAVKVSNKSILFFIRYKNNKTANNWQI